MIMAGGEEVTVLSIDRYDDDGYLTINAGPYQHAPGSVYLYEDRYGNYVPARYGHPAYDVLAVIGCRVTDTLLFLDYTSADTGDAVSLPRVSTADEFIAGISSGTLDLSIDNVYVVFDGDGQLATVQRFFVSWQ